MSAAYIPTPIYFGAVIDTTCMLWQQDCGIHGSCWEYDVTSFRFVYFGLAASLKFVGFVFIFLTWYSIKYKEDRLERWQRHLPPLSTVSELICHAGGHKSHARTRSLPCFHTPSRAPRPAPAQPRTLQPELPRKHPQSNNPTCPLAAGNAHLRNVSHDICLHVPSCQMSSSMTRQRATCAFRGLLRSPISMSPVQTHSKYTLRSICCRSVWKTTHGAKWGTERTFLCIQSWIPRLLYQRRNTSTNRYQYYATLYRIKASRLPLSTVWS